MTSRSILLLHSICNDGSSTSSRESNSTAAFTEEAHDDKRFAWQELQQTTPLVCNLLLMPEIPLSPAAAAAATTTHRKSNADRTQQEKATKPSFRERRQQAEGAIGTQQQQVLQIDPLQLNPCGMDNVLLLTDLPAAAPSHDFLLSITSCRFDFYHDDGRAMALPVDPIPSTFFVSFAPQDGGDLFFYVPPAAGSSSDEDESRPTEGPSSFAEVSLAFDVSEAHRIFQEYHRGNLDAIFNEYGVREDERLQQNTTTAKEPVPPQAAPNHKPYQRSNQESLFLEELHIMELREDQFINVILRGMAGLIFILVVAFLRVLQRVRRNLKILESQPTQLQIPLTTVEVATERIPDTPQSFITSATSPMTENSSPDTEAPAVLCVDPASDVAKIEAATDTTTTTTTTTTQSVEDYLTASLAGEPPQYSHSPGRASLTLPVRLDFTSAEEKTDESALTTTTSIVQQEPAKEPATAQEPNKGDDDCTVITPLEDPSAGAPPFFQELIQAARLKKSKAKVARVEATASTMAPTAPSQVDDAVTTVVGTTQSDAIPNEAPVLKTTACLSHSTSDTQQPNEGSPLEEDTVELTKTGSFPATAPESPKAGLRYYTTTTTPMGESPKRDITQEGQQETTTNEQELSPCSKLAKQWEDTKSVRRRKKNQGTTPHRLAPALPPIKITTNDTKAASGTTTINPPLRTSLSSRVDPTQIFSPFSSMPQASETTKRKKSKHGQKKCVKSLYISPFISTPPKASPASTTGSERSFLEDYW